MTPTERYHKERRKLRAEIAELKAQILEKQKALMNLTFHPEKYFKGIDTKHKEYMVFYRLNNTGLYEQFKQNLPLRR